ncbi:MAG: tetratricopeptide repeat protein [Pyrinomonadaceae bacterium]
MFRTSHFLKVLFSLTAFFSISFQSLAVKATDIVATDDVVNGASVFVFRESRKKPQERAGGGVSLGGGRVRSYREKLNAQIAENRRKKAAAAKARAAALAKARARQKLAKLKLSNTLAAAAERDMEAGDIASATTNYRSSLKANPKNVEAISGLSEALTATGLRTASENYDEAAIALFDEAVKLNPKNEIAFSKLGEIHDARGRNALAITNYEKALAIDPALSSLYVPIALAYAEAGNALKADIYLTKAEVTGADGTDARFARGVLLQKQNKYQESLVIFDQIVAAEPQNGAASYQRAVIFDKLGQTDKALDAYKKTTQIDPSYAPAWFELGVIYYNKGDYNRAAVAYQEAVKADPGNAKAHANLASAYRQLERYPEANAEYKIAAQTIKNDADLYSEWGFCLGKTNEWDKATVRLEEARGMRTSAVEDTNVGWAYYNAAQAEKNEEEAKIKLEKGKASLQQAVQKDPNLDAAYLNLGSTQNSLGEHDEAVVSLNQAVKLHDDWTVALNQLGLAYRGKNDLPTALSNFNRVVYLDGNNIAGLFNLGSTQYASGDKKGAKKTQDRLRRVSPDLANQLGNVIAGRVVDFGVQKLREKIRIPGIPF